MTTRRHFIEKLTAPLVELPLLTATECMGNQYSVQDGKVLRVAILGLGSYGNRVADRMKDCKRAKLVGVVSGTPSKIKDWQARFNIPDKNCYNYENFDNIRNNPDIDAVYVITPNSLHKDFVI